MGEASWKKIRVYLLDDHPIVREGFARALYDEPDMVVVGQGGTAAEALRDAPTLKPDVILVDLNLPDRDGIELLALLRPQVPKAKLLVFSGYEDGFRAAEALRAGAQGYLIKTSGIEEVIGGIRSIVSGGAPLSPRIAGAVVRAMQKTPQGDSGGVQALTARERQVLLLLATGTTTRETAKRLTISPKTVETHRVRIYAKLGCKTAVELTRICVRSGIIEA